MTSIPEIAYVPIITPFTEQYEIDFESFEKQLKFLLLNGIKGIVVCGTTGEGHFLTLDEKKKLIEFTANYKKKTTPKFSLIVATATSEISEAIEVAKYAEEKGAAGILALPPKTNNQEEIQAFYEELHKNTQLPILAYQIPFLTHSNITPETISKLIYSGAIIGLKDSSEDHKLILQWVKVNPKCFLIVGEDKFIRLGMIEGKAKAVIAGAGNIGPKELVKLFETAKNGKGQKEQLVFNIIVDDLLKSGPDKLKQRIKNTLKKNGVIATSKVRL